MSEEIPVRDPRVLSVLMRPSMNDDVKPICKLSGSDGNVFVVIANVSRALVRAGHRDKADEFKAKALKMHSYDDVLELCFDYVEVE